LKRRTELLRVCPISGSIRGVVSAIASNVIPEKGEFVVVVSGAVNRASKYESSIDEERLLAELLRELPPAKAASIVARLTRSSRSDLYSKALEMKQDL
jgi:16S rRNA (cytidine1402-2'-O)-methyltransferase